MNVWFAGWTRAFSKLNGIIEEFYKFNRPFQSISRTIDLQLLFNKGMIT